MGGGITKCTLEIKQLLVLFITGWNSNKLSDTRATLVKTEGQRDIHFTVSITFVVLCISLGNFEKYHIAAKFYPPFLLA